MFFHRKNGEGIDLSKLNRNTREEKLIIPSFFEPISAHSIELIIIMMMIL